MKPKWTKRYAQITLERERDEARELAHELRDALNRLSNEWEYQEKIGNVPVGRVEAAFAQDALDKAKEVLGET